MRAVKAKRLRAQAKAENPTLLDRVYLIDKRTGAVRCAGVRMHYQQLKRSCS